MIFNNSFISASADYLNITEGKLEDANDLLLAIPHIPDSFALTQRETHLASAAAVSINCIKEITALISGRYDGLTRLDALTAMSGSNSFKWCADETADAINQQNKIISTINMVCAVVAGMSAMFPNGETDLTTPEIIIRKILFMIQMNIEEARDDTLDFNLQLIEQNQSTQKLSNAVNNAEAA